MTVQIKFLCTVATSVFGSFKEGDIARLPKWIADDLVKIHKSAVYVEPVEVKKVEVKKVK